MFDVSFSELMLIGVVALVVIGPERLPKVARTAGQWLGRLNRYVAQVKQDIDRDIKLEELRKMQQEMKDTAQRYEIQAGESLRQAEETVTQETGSISKAMDAMGTSEAALTKQDAATAAAAVPAVPEAPPASPGALPAAQSNDKVA